AAQRRNPLLYPNCSPATPTHLSLQFYSTSHKRTGAPSIAHFAMGGMYALNQPPRRRSCLCFCVCLCRCSWDQARRQPSIHTSRRTSFAFAVPVASALVVVL